MKNPKKLELNTEPHFSSIVPKRQREYYKKLWTPPENNDADTILNWLYNRGLVQNYIKKLEYENIDEETIQDEIQEIWLLLTEKKDYLKLLYDTQGITGLTATVAGIIHRQIHSNSSQIYNKYKKRLKVFKRISDKSWEVYDTTGEMILTNYDYLTTEEYTDLIIKHIENNDMDKLYELLHNKSDKNK